jgi:alpha-L-rhamnosidase
MKNHIATVAILFLATIFSAADPTNLSCEYRENPFGIDVVKPRLSWIVEGQSDKDTEVQSGRGIKQTAYQILVASSEELLKNDTGDLWDSGKVESDQSVHVEYAGKPLGSRMQCYWKVRVWKTKQKKAEGSGWSRTSEWTMGFLKPEDWSAKWIGSDRAYLTTNVLGSAQWVWFPEGELAASAPKSK